MRVRAQTLLYSMILQHMKKVLTPLALLVFTIAAAQEDAEINERMSCTSIMVGRKASTDGSVMTSHTCDGRYRTWMQWVEAADHKPDAKLKIYQGRMHTETPQGMEGVTVKGEIPQVAHTFRFLDSCYPCLNERRLGIGETTIGGRDTLRNRKGMFMIEELQRVALQRCTSAREAIRLMGDLIKTYGYGDSGECLTIADTAEVWIFEVFGEGPKHVGGVWAAQRIPDDEVSVSANNCRIGRIELGSIDFMASENVFDVARKLKLWDGKSEFSFWKAYAGCNYNDEVKNYSTRELFILSTLAPSKGFSDALEELPVSVKPDKQVSLSDVFKLLATYYEGTELDYTQRLYVPNKSKKKVGDSIPEKIISPRANPWMRSDETAVYAAAGDTTFSKWIRPVAVSYCAYSIVIQLKGNVSEGVGGIAWVSYDNPGESPRFPVYCGGTRLPKICEICGNHSYRDDCALWRFRRTNKLATVRWGNSRSSLEPARDYFLEKALREQKLVENTFAKLNSEDKASGEEFLNNYTSDFLGAAILKWDELYRKFWDAHWSGF